DEATLASWWRLQTYDVTRDACIPGYSIPAREHARIPPLVAALPAPVPVDLGARARHRRPLRVDRVHLDGAEAGQGRVHAEAGPDRAEGEDRSVRPGGEGDRGALHRDRSPAEEPRGVLPPRRAGAARRHDARAVEDRPDPRHPVSGGHQPRRAGEDRLLVQEQGAPRHPPAAEARRPHEAADLPARPLGLRPRQEPALAPGLLGPPPGTPYPPGARQPPA